MLFLHINGSQRLFGTVLSSAGCWSPVRIQRIVWMFAATSHSLVFNGDSRVLAGTAKLSSKSPALFKGQPGTQDRIVFGNKELKHNSIFMQLISPQVTLLVFSILPPTWSQSLSAYLLLCNPPCCTQKLNCFHTFCSGPQDLYPACDICLATFS